MLQLLHHTSRDRNNNGSALRRAPVATISAAILACLVAATAGVPPAAAVAASSPPHPRPPPPRPPPIFGRGINDTIANFNSPPTVIRGVTEPFFFGFANSPSQNEDQLNDDWLDWARQGRVDSWQAVPRAEERTQFYTRTEAELNLAQAAGAKMFRLGVSWERIVPTDPNLSPANTSVANAAALARYREILLMIRQRGMRTMLTLHHFSTPRWAIARGGWTQPSIVNRFREYTALVVDAFGDLVDYWVPVNEPTIYALSAYCAAAFPTNFPPFESELDFWFCFQVSGGRLDTALNHLMDGHRAAHDAIRSKFQNAPVGCAGIHQLILVPNGIVPACLTDVIAATFVAARLNGFTRTLLRQRDTLDFVGLQYYGSTLISGGSSFAVSEAEVGDTGTTLDANYFYQFLVETFKTWNLPIIITENGIADGADALRPAFIVEHLLAVDAARKAGIPIAGYLHWTLSDNWELVTGYCPKFGQVAINRSTANLTRTPRGSYFIYQQIAQGKQITQGLRDSTWGDLLQRANNGGLRDFCKALSPTGTVLDNLAAPIKRPLSKTQTWGFKAPSDGGFGSPTSWLASLGRTFRFCSTAGSISGGRDTTLGTVVALPRPPRPPPLPPGQRAPPSLLGKPLWVNNK